MKSRLIFLRPPVDIPEITIEVSPEITIDIPDCIRGKLPIAKSHGPQKHNAEIAQGNILGKGSQFF